MEKRFQEGWKNPATFLNRWMRRNGTSTMRLWWCPDPGCNRRHMCTTETQVTGMGNLLLVPVTSLISRAVEDRIQICLACRSGDLNDFPGAQCTTQPSEYTTRRWILDIKASEMAVCETAFSIYEWRGSTFLLVAQETIHQYRGENRSLRDTIPYFRLVGFMVAWVDSLQWVGTSIEGLHHRSWLPR